MTTIHIFINFETISGVQTSQDYECSGGLIVPAYVINFRGEIALMHWSDDKRIWKFKIFRFDIDGTGPFERAALKNTIQSVAQKVNDCAHNIR